MSIENQEVSSFYETAKQHLGFLIMKPDAVELGIAEDLVAIATERLWHDSIKLLHGEVVIVNNEQELRCLYPHITEPDVWCHLQKYFISNPITINIFHSVEPRPMEQIIKRVKGPRVRDWSIAELEGCRSVNDFLRALIPVPGTEHLVTPLISKIIDSKRKGYSFRFSDEEFAVYSRNLVHSPEGEAEYTGVMQLLSHESAKIIVDSTNL